MTNEPLDQLAINTIGTLSMDAVQQANSGHPGTPMAMAPLSRVVSMPSWDIFEHQTQEYRDSLLAPKVKARVAVEQASIF